MGVDTVAAFVDAVRQGRLLEGDQLEELVRVQARASDVRALAKQLIQKAWLTPFQVNQILQGQAASLAVGQYRLLERIGEGGMGQVFKARHHAMGRIVALKVIRKERLGNEQAVKRFQREIQAASQLSHPNVVLAFDANAAGAVHYLAMEFVEGTDLTRLCREKGPLPVHDACDYIRQAALGLQYAHERGMVHRDIKPSNLLVTNAAAPNSSAVIKRGAPARPLVKILDMGLARLQPHEQSDNLTQLSVDGSVMGTPDFMAPEQAKNSHKVDHRADIYSLGCTFYYLLSGQPPFAGTSHLEKLLKHQMDDPPPIERSDIPEGVQLILKRMLAKRPEERFQTGDEVVAALAPFCDPMAVTAGHSPAAVRASLPTARQTAPRGGGPTTSTAVLGQATRTTDLLYTTPEVARPIVSPRRRARSRTPVVIAALALFLACGGALVLWAMSGKPAGKTSPVVASAAGAVPTSAATPRVTSPTGTTPTPTTPPLHRYLPDNTNVVIAITFNDLRRSAFFRRFGERLPLPPLSQITNDLGNLNIDAEKELQRMVIAGPGTGRPAEAFFVYQGSFSNDRVRDALRRDKAEPRQVRGIKGPPGTYYVVKTDEHTFHFALPAPGTLLIGLAEPSMPQVLEKLALPRPSLTDSHLRDTLDRVEGKPPPLQVFIGGGYVPDGGDKSIATTLPGVRVIAAGLVPDGDGVSIRVGFLCSTTEAARDLDAFVRATLKILAEGDKDQWAAFAKALSRKNTKFISPSDKPVFMVETNFGPELLDRFLPPAPKKTDR